MNNQQIFSITALLFAGAFLVYSLNTEYQTYTNPEEVTEVITTDSGNDKTENFDEEKNKYHEEYDSDYPEPQKYKNIYVNDQINKMFPNNYLDRILSNDKLVRWHHTSFPLKVYVEYKPSLPAYYKPAIEEAFMDWQNAANEIISFKFIADQNEADIKCLFPEDFDTRIKKNENIVGLAHHNINNGKINDAVIEFASYIKSKPINKEFLRAVAAHEIGHALGLNGHSLNKQDIMYPTTQNNQHISDADINTLKFLYSIIPDISDKKYDEQYRDKFWTTDDILGDSNQRFNMAIQRMKNDVEITNNYRYNNYAKLMGYQYYKNKDYKNALKEYQEALKHVDTEDSEQISYISYMIANCYYELKDYDQAIKYADYYYDKEKDENRLNFIADIYIKSQKTDNAKKVLISIINRNPKNYNAYILLGNIYNEENNLNLFIKLADKAKMNFPNNPPILYEIKSK